MRKQNGYFDQLFDTPRLSTFLTTRHRPFESVFSELNPHSLPLTRMNQVHSNRVAIAKTAASQTFDGVDATITTVRNLYISVRTADCLPVVIYHPSPVIAVVHAGRRGTEAGVLTETILQAQSLSGYTGFQYWFGPAICFSCYEIDREKKLHFDLVKENTAQIYACDPGATIRYSKLCTSCQNHDFFSYRKGDKTDRILTVAKLN